MTKCFNLHLKQLWFNLNIGLTIPILLHCSTEMMQLHLHQSQAPVHPQFSISTLLKNLLFKHSIPIHLLVQMIF
jgi:hypothetical protein